MQQCVKIVFWQNFGDVKKRGIRKENCIFGFSFLCWRPRNRKKKNNKMEKAKNAYKNCFFWRWSSKNVKNEKNGFLAKIDWHYLCQKGRKNAHFRAHYLFWPKIFIDQNSVSRKHYKNRVSAEIAKKQKWHLFWEKGVFWHGWKSGFY